MTQKYKTNTTQRQTTLSYRDVEKASKRLNSVTYKTPLKLSKSIADETSSNKIGLKLENLQKTNAFKIRGAYNKISQLDKTKKQKGVVTASSGNHAQGVALAAKKEGINATVIVPENTPKTKIDSIKKYGAEVILHGTVFNKAYQKAKKHEKQTGKTFIHPYNDKKVMAGQGTIGKELVQQFPELDTVFVAIGGGGLISGIGTAVKHLKPETQVIGVQTEGCGTIKQSLKQGKVYKKEHVDTIADGIKTKHVGKTALKQMKQVVDKAVYVKDKEVKTAMKKLLKTEKQVAEPAGAVALAATLNADKYGIDITDRNVAVPVCGGNIDLKKFNQLIGETQ